MNSLILIANPRPQYIVSEMNNPRFLWCCRLNCEICNQIRIIWSNWWHPILTNQIRASTKSCYNIFLLFTYIAMNEKTSVRQLSRAFKVIHFLFLFIAESKWKGKSPVYVVLPYLHAFIKACTYCMYIVCTFRVSPFFSMCTMYLGALEFSQALTSSSLPWQLTVKSISNL